MELSDRQERFCREFIIDLNGTQAAIRAGYAKNSANEQASRLLAKSNISARISQLKQVTAKKLEITAERVLQEYARIAFLDPRKFYNEDGSMKALHELTEDEAAALSGLDTEELFEMQGRKRVQIGTVKKLKFWNKTEALDALARYVGTIFDKDNGQKKPDVLPMTDDQVGKLITALKKK